MINGHIEFGSPEHSNIRLSQQAFISSPADVKAFHYLEMRVKALARSDDVIEIPGYAGDGSWNVLYATYTKLKQRAERESFARASSNAFAPAASRTTWEPPDTWARYRLLREEIADALSRAPIESYVLEYVGLRKEDRADPAEPVTNENPYGRRAHWLQGYERLASAWSRLKMMTPDERRSIPLLLEMRKLHTTVADLGKRLVALELTGKETKNEKV